MGSFSQHRMPLLRAISGRAFSRMLPVQRPDELHQHQPAAVLPWSELYLLQEVAMLEKKPVAGAKFIPGSASNPLEWTMMLDAPDTYTVGGAKRACPYAGHVFTVSIKFPNNYPFKAPDVSV
jgi:hypothetical protein